MGQGVALPGHSTYYSFNTNSIRFDGNPAIYTAYSVLEKLDYTPLFGSSDHVLRRMGCRMGPGESR